jgi:hypothetical protein
MGHRGSALQMREVKSRSLNLGDWTILIAATALACGLVRHNFQTAKLGPLLPYKPPDNYSFVFALAIYPFWLCWTYAALIIRLRPTRPPWRHLTRQPGAIATLAVSICVPFLFLISLHAMSRYGWRIRMGIPIQCYPYLPNQLAFVVFGVWLAQGINKRWRPEGSAIDRMGRFLGSGWIAFYIAYEGWVWVYE